MTKIITKSFSVRFLEGILFESFYWYIANRKTIFVAVYESVRWRNRSLVPFDNEGPGLEFWPRFCRPWKLSFSLGNLQKIAEATNCNIEPMVQNVFSKTRLCVPRRLVQIDKAGLYFIQWHALKRSRGHLRPATQFPRQIQCSSQQRFFAAPTRTGADPDDTIYALSTAPGRAAIAIVRISGPQCLQVTSSYTLKSQSTSNWSLRYTMHYVLIPHFRTLENELLELSTTPQILEISSILKL